MTIADEQYRIIVESSPNMIWRSGKDALCDYFNTTWLNFTGRTMEQEIGNGWAEGVHPDDFDRCLKIYLEAFEQRKPFEMEYRLRRHDGQWRWIKDRGVPYYVDNAFAGFIGSCMDVNENVEGQKLLNMAQKDGLTGINNRQYFELLASEEVKKARRFAQSLCLVMMDIDRFKTVNDKYGHQAGDKVLKETARLLKQSIRDLDLLGRYGGDEFVILFPDTSYDEALLIIDRINTAVTGTRLLYNESVITFSMSFGVCEMHDEENLEKIVGIADEKLYRSKQQKYNDR
ncbi:MAG: sensor domain-containing diguanylate cyclase [Bacillota bacterium]